MSKHRSEWKDINEFFNEFFSDDNLCRIFKEYVEESIHGGWNGFSSRDITGIRRFLIDFIIYYKNR